MPPEYEVVKTTSGKLRGFTQHDEDARAKHLAFIARLEAGEYFTVKYTRPRNPVLHRKFFAMLNVGFDAWEPEKGRKRNSYKGLVIEKRFEQFRKDILILAGFGEPSYDLKGRLHWDAKSIAFDKMDDDEFMLVYSAVQKVLLEHVLTNYSRDDLNDVVEKLQGFVPT